MGESSASARVNAAAPTIDVAGHAKPYVTYVLIAINVLVFGAVVLQAGGFTNLGRSAIMQQGALISGGGFENEYWRLVTSGFLHWSVIHLAVNMFSLYVIGADLERLFGRGRYLAVYVIGLLGGSAAVMALEPGLKVTAGASGAIYGLLGALLIVILRLKLPATTVIAVIVINVVLSISIPGISLLGHLGGLVFGAAAAAAVIWLPVKILPPERQTAQQVTKIGWYGLTALAVIALVIGTSFAVEASL
ncbi:rhomboid family intramembrane serine protease [Gordonia hydrophobica]|uniref:Rhomboid family intramembrane serine protease n=1 Tax=Gordonia hydrophobica TaxID=40516 RepID=A0ABZ2U532_9ACTN|nr:rhomboid family intramembrane serine protease [Gordonia hydrophobica]MBM7368675.1 membrane associated rhomboid family serine protease [Gordonia hydrophobica]